MKHLFLYVALMLVTASAQAESPRVNYVSSDAVYVSVGSRAGLAIGSRLAVLRDKREIAVIEVRYVSSFSASCKIIEASAAPAAGDLVSFEAVTPASGPAPTLESVPTRPPPEARGKRDQPDLRGYVTFQNMWINDVAGNGSASSLQPAINVRLIAHNLTGGSTFSLRHRSRLYYRPNTGNQAWIHRLSELALRFGNTDGRPAFGVGRMIVDEVYGLGYIDGAYASLPLAGNYRMGVVGGFEPGNATLQVRPNTRKMGVFASWRGRGSTHDAAITTALSSSYVDGFVNREFAYLQSTYSYATKIYFYNSVEVDLNRQWRKTPELNRLEFSNLLLSVSATPWTPISVDAAYDARKNYRDYESFATPDSLFDAAYYSGYGAGITLRFPSAVQVRINGGIRYRGADAETNRYHVVTVSARKLPLHGHSMTLRWAVAETPFLRGYRPTLSDHFAVGRRLRMKVGGGAYIFQQGPIRTNTGFVEIGAYRTIRSRYFINGELRQYVGGNTDSSQLFAEAGLNF